jgi:serine/threonine-protein kinase
VLPSNTTDPDAPVSDARLTQMGAAMGTPAFMAPEQALGHELDGRADTYALGCVAFYLLTGRLVFEKTASLPMMMAHITEEIPDVTSLCKTAVPAALVDVIRKCLAKQPEERFASPRDLAAALRAISFPESERWSTEKAEAWWQEHRPRSKPLSGVTREPIAS